jgi:hypothetical protein
VYRSIATAACVLVSRKILGTRGAKALRAPAETVHNLGVAKRIGQIIVSDVFQARLRTAFPDCEIAAIGADLQITFLISNTGRALQATRAASRTPGGVGLRSG